MTKRTLFSKGSYGQSVYKGIQTTFEAITNFINFLHRLSMQIMHSDGFKSFIFVTITWISFVLLGLIVSPILPGNDTRKNVRCDNNSLTNLFGICATNAIMFLIIVIFISIPVVACSYAFVMIICKIPGVIWNFILTATSIFCTIIEWTTNLTIETTNTISMLYTKMVQHKFFIKKMK